MDAYMVSGKIVPKGSAYLDFFGFRSATPDEPRCLPDTA
jgi:hypothetical protein